MHEIEISQLVRVLEAIQDWKILPPCDSKGFVRRYHLQMIEDHLKDLRRYQDLLDLDPGIRQQMSYLQDRIDEDMGDTSPDRLVSLTDSLHESIVDALKNRKFLYMPSQDAKFYISDHLFPGNLVERFPDAIHDVLDAETAFAVGLYTACVFHSMRVAEHGLRFIATALKVDITDNGKPCPVEFVTWEKVLQAIENKRAELRRETKSGALIQQQRYYAEAASHCAHLKDWFRNDAMHSRRSYVQAEALAALSRSAEFMALVNR